MVKTENNADKNRPETQGSDEKNSNEPKEEFGQHQTTRAEESPSETDLTGIVRQEELLQLIEDLKAENEQLKDKFLRKAAEFENFKRRTEQEGLSLRQYATESLILDLLPILDDFERSLRVSKERREFGAFYKGVELIYQKFLKSLEAKGLSPIDAAGKPFDVDLHDALMQIAREDIEPHTVVEEIERGYKLHDRVIRHSKVIVASQPEQDSIKSSDPDNDSDRSEDEV
jgi:molecular chaperone GrpE